MTDQVKIAQAEAEAEECFRSAAHYRALAVRVGTPMLAAHFRSIANDFSRAGRLFQEGYSLTARRLAALTHRRVS